jgi:hypothetical protein
MINTVSIPMPCAPSRLLPGASPFAAALDVRTVAVDVQVQGTGLPTHVDSKYGSLGSEAWSPPD